MVRSSSLERGQMGHVFKIQYLPNGLKENSNFLVRSLARIRAVLEKKFRPKGCKTGLKSNLASFTTFWKGVQFFQPNSLQNGGSYHNKSQIIKYVFWGVLPDLTKFTLIPVTVSEKNHQNYIAGFPSRWNYIEFFYRYRVLCKLSNIDRNNMQKTCQNILGQHIKNPDMYQFGKTKIFFRAGQVAYLEKVRYQKLKACCIMMQKTVRAFVARRKYQRIRRSVLLVQKHGRGLLARR